MNKFTLSAAALLAVFTAAACNLDPQTYTAPQAATVVVSDCVIVEPDGDLEPVNPALCVPNSTVYVLWYNATLRNGHLVGGTRKAPKGVKALNRTEYNRRATYIAPVTPAKRPTIVVTPPKPSAVTPPKSPNWKTATGSTTYTAPKPATVTVKTGRR